MKTLILMWMLVVSSAAAPNFVVVLIDDMGWGDFSCFGNTEAETPFIDQLAEEGIRFENFYVNSPICSPSRCALTTGQYPQRHGIESYLSNRKHNAERGVENWLSVDAPVLARFLNEAGYTTAHFGKWHLGGQRDVGEAPLITEYGFDESLTNFEGLGPRLLGIKYSPEEEKPGYHDIGSQALGRGPIYWEDRSTITGLFAQAVLEFIRKAEEAEMPFYVNLWPDDTHTPMVPPLHDWGDGKDRTLYNAVLEEMDHQMSRVWRHIQRSKKLQENTMILVCSDNGPEVGFGDSGPYFGSKATLYEAGVRSPLVVWAPGMMEEKVRGKVNRESVFSAMDLVPSLLQLAGLNPGDAAEFDGEDVADVLLGGEGGRKAPLFWRRPPDRKEFRHYTELPDLAMRQGEWKLLCDYDGGRAQLFRINDDPGQTRDHAEEFPEVVMEMVEAVREWDEGID